MRSPSRAAPPSAPTRRATQLLTEDGSALELASATGHLSELLERYGRLSTDQEVPAVAGGPLGGGALVRVGRRAGRALSRPRAGAGRARGGRLRAADRPRAAARPAHRQLRPAARLSGEDRALIDVLLQQCGQALERAAALRARAGRAPPRRGREPAARPAPDDRRGEPVRGVGRRASCTTCSRTSAASSTPTGRRS